MKYLFLTLSIVLSSLITNAQKDDFWEIIPDPFPHDIYSINSIGDTIFMGTKTGGGIYLTKNWGESWDTSLECASVYSLEVNELNYIYAGRGGNIYRSVDYGNSWQNVYGGTGSNVLAIDTYPGGLMFANARHNGVGEYMLRSHSYGDLGTWEEPLTTPDSVFMIRAAKIRNHDTIYFGDYNFIWGGGVYASYDGGDNWGKMGLDSHFVSALEINSKGDLFACTNGHMTTGDGGVYVLRKGEQEWEPVLNGVIISSILITDEDSIYVGCAYESPFRGVLCSSDYGSNWRDVSAGIVSPGIEDLCLTSSGYLLASSIHDSILYKSREPVVNNIGYIEKEKITLETYPNPCRDVLHIKSGNNDLNNSTLHIYNTLGSLVDVRRTTSCVSGLIVISTKSLEDGMYFYKIETKGNEAIKGKFIKITNI